MFHDLPDAPKKPDRVADVGFSGPITGKPRKPNIANGHQQISNGFVADTHAHAGEFKIPPNELLESGNVVRLDTGTPRAAGGSNSALETLGAVHRA